MGMITLPNFPFRNQLADVRSADGEPAENAAYDCVPTCLAACIQYYTGKVVAADDLKDAVYGQGHIGGGNELTYADLVKARYGLVLTHNNLPSASQAMIDDIRANLRAGRPVIVTMHSQWSRLWNQDAGDGLHVGVAYSIDESNAGLLHIMNPWRGFDHVQPVAWWRARLGNGTYPVAKLAQAPVVALPAGWHDDGTTLTTANGVPVVKGFRQYVLAKLAANAWHGGDALVPEWGDATMTRQPFAATLLEWTPQSGVYEGAMADALTLVAHEHQGKAA